MVNIGVGPSNAKTITDHLAVLRPDLVLMIGHCAGLRNHQDIGDLVLATAYMRDDHVLDDMLPLSVPVVSNYTLNTLLLGELTARGLRSRKGIVFTTANRNWELNLATVEQRLRLSRAMAVDMESATVAANGFRYRIPTATLLAVSDKPLHARPKLSADAQDFYTASRREHVEIAISVAGKVRQLTPPACPRPISARPTSRCSAPTPGLPSPDRAWRRESRTGALDRAGRGGSILARCGALQSSWRAGRWARSGAWRPSAGPGRSSGSFPGVRCSRAPPMSVSSWPPRPPGSRCRRWVLHACGEVVARIGSYHVRVYEWAELARPAEPPVGDRTAAEAGRLLGVLHSLALPTTEPDDPWYAEVRPWCTGQRSRTVPRRPEWPGLARWWAHRTALPGGARARVCRGRGSCARLPPGLQPGQRRPRLDRAIISWSSTGRTPGRWIQDASSAMRSSPFPPVAAGSAPRRSLRCSTATRPPWAPTPHLGRACSAPPSPRT